ncbi:type II secretion system protein GspL [Thermodesulfobacteriota bacterium]
MSRKIFGLDIQNDAVSAVLVRSSVKGNRVEAYQRVSISDQGDIEDPLIRSLEMITERIDFAGSVCVAAVPADQISFRNVRVPFKDQKKIRQILPFELEPKLPFSVDDIIIDFHPVNMSDHSDIIAATMDTSRLQSYLEALASLKIDPEIVTIGGYAAALCLAHMGNTPGNALFVDINKHNSSVFSVVSGQIYLMRSFPLVSSGSSRIESLCINIERTISAFDSFFDLSFEPEGVFITGYDPDDAGVEAEMERVLKIPARRADLARGTDGTPADQPGQSWEPGRMNNALALSLIEIEGIQSINFRRGPFAAKRRWAEHKKGMIRTGILSGLILVLIVVNMLINSYVMKTKVARLDTRITDIFKTTFPDLKRIVDPVQQMRMKINAKRKANLLPGELGENRRVIDMLRAVSQQIPKKTDVNLSRLVIGEENILISGDTDTFNTVDDIKIRLEAVDFFKTITITSTNKDKSGNRIRFKMKLVL